MARPHALMGVNPPLSSTTTTPPSFSASSPSSTALTIAARPPMPEEHVEAQRITRQAAQEAINEVVAAWYESTKATAMSLHERFGRPVEHYEAMFFNYADRAHKTRKESAYNAFLSEKYDAIPEAERGDVVSFQDGLKDEYNRLTQEEKEDYLNRHRQKKALKKVNARMDQRSVSAIFRHAETSIRHTMQYLNSRTNGHGFVCLVRGSPEYAFEPSWYFSSPRLEEFLRLAIWKGFNPQEIGAKSEAFFVAGGKTINIFSTAAEKAKFLKNCIQEKINTGLVTASGDTSARMAWVFYEEDIVQRYGVHLEGWTHREWKTPSKLSNSVPPLEVLHDALLNGTCKWVVLNTQQRHQRLQEFERRVAAGEITRKTRNQRSDAGKKRASGGNDDDDEESESSDDEVAVVVPRRKKKKTTV